MLQNDGVWSKRIELFASLWVWMDIQINFWVFMIYQLNHITHTFCLLLEKLISYPDFLGPWMSDLLPIWFMHITFEETISINYLILFDRKLCSANHLPHPSSNRKLLLSKLCCSFHFTISRRLVFYDCCRLPWTSFLWFKLTKPQIQNEALKQGQFWHTWDRELL